MAYSSILDFFASARSSSVVAGFKIVDVRVALGLGPVRVEAFGGAAAGKDSDAGAVLGGGGVIV